MFRRDLIALLRDARSVHDLARELDARPAEIEEDLVHLLRSLRRGTEYRAVVVPARCRRCGFTFRDDRLSKPGKCPRCRHTWIAAPLVRIEPAGDRSG
ncbi:transcriptional regulator [Sulfurifustis variabilis]|uniref:Transcriptional regulator n=1 Tax=Sulfurifustis variabilis TaxID=1675686 RepID=A0A1C7AFX4_9GAMM|nr:hypothetical protein [Sulfurifustis variabilis]BAU50325.1 transcriptional regulator [Sulfurifustis variabilis]